MSDTTKQPIIDINCDSCHTEDVCVRHVPAFMKLTETEIQAIADLVEHRDYGNMELIFREGDPMERLIILRRGKVKLFRHTHDGEEIVLDIMTPGDIHGGEELFSDNQQKESALAMGKVGVCLIAYDQIKEVIMKQPVIGIKIMEYLSMKLNQSHALLEIISTRDTLKKLVMFLLERRQRTGGDILELTQSDIGNSIHLTKETVNRKLGELSQAGLIEKSHGRITLKDIEALENIIQS